ncbi:unnamed protein product [Pieris macdunnoughi]|uniref:Uncharacterized protein n=1 Tax=Pieris macdunnoughi TaxID=345717 RepID=A0A821S4F9_9NEOP|nr:unnamed protein product [Pieris macdunnoughi]
MSLYRGEVAKLSKKPPIISSGSRYQLFPHDCIQRRTIRTVDNENLSERFDPLALRRDLRSLCMFYQIYHGSSMAWNGMALQRSCMDL